jgi:hypothetical protein
MGAGSQAIATTDAKLAVDHYMVTAAVVAIFDRTDRDTFVAVDTFISVNRYDLFYGHIRTPAIVECMVGQRSVP